MLRYCTIIASNSTMNPREEGTPGIIRGPNGQPVVQMKGITMGASQRAEWIVSIKPRILAAQGNATGETLEWMKTDKKPLEFNNHFGEISSGYIGVLKELFPECEYGWFAYYLDHVPNYMPYMTPDNITMISVGRSSSIRKLRLS